MKIESNMKDKREHYINQLGACKEIEQMKKITQKILIKLNILTCDGIFENGEISVTGLNKKNILSYPIAVFSCSLNGIVEAKKHFIKGYNKVWTHIWNTSK